MSMMMPPDPTAGGGMPLPPGGGPPGLPPPPMDSMSSTPLPGDQGIGGLIAALQGGAGGPSGASPDDPAAALPSDPTGPGGPGGLGQPLGAPDGSPDMADMSPVEHIQHAMKHLMMAMAGETDDSRGTGIVKGMGALQAILGGEQKKQKVLADASGPGG